MNVSKVYLQSTATECGLACIGYIAAYFGSAIEMSELRARFAISLQGATLVQLSSIANDLGMTARPLRLEVEELENLRLPCILHWNMNHYVVLKKVSRTGIVVHDPAHGERTIGMGEVRKSFTGVAIELKESSEFEQIKPRPPITIRKLVGKITGIKRSLFQMLVLAIGLQILALITPMIIQWVVDGAIVSGDKSFLTVLGFGFAAIAVFRICLEYIRGVVSLALSFDFQIQWAGRVVDHLFKVPLSWYELRHIGDITSRFDSVRSIQQTLTGRVIEVILDGLFSVVLLFVMLLYSPVLTVFVLMALTLYFLVRTLPHGHFHKVNEEAVIHEARTQTHFLESLRGVQTIKLSGLEDQRRIRWTNLFVEGANKRVQSQKMTLGFSTGYGLIFSFETIGVLGVGASMTIDGIFTVGMLMAFISFKEDFISRVQRLIDNGMAIRMLSLHVERLADIVLTDKEKLSGKDGAISVEDSEGISIEFVDVSFKYGDMSPWVIRELNLTIRAGEHVAIVGPSGCGKSTFSKLLLGLLKPTSGEIRVCGVPLHEFGLSKWRAMVGAVMQDDQLFSGSIQENIASFGEIDSTRVKNSASLAAIHDEVIKMPMGYMTLNGDMGSTLSGGQKQRVLLARALYKSPSLLVLDEATSHLDVHRERLVNRSVAGLNITRVTIAHRPETIAMADRAIDLSEQCALAKRESAVA